jgi:hypothetical protein
MEHLMDELNDILDQLDEIYSKLFDMGLEYSASQVMNTMDSLEQEMKGRHNG